jgi:Ni,Fe-hydrogenase III small subunit/ferredoxin
MWRVLRSRLRQGHRTIAFPAAEPVLPAGFRGRPVLDDAACADGCRKCIEQCPAGALELRAGRLTMDLGRCLFCGECEAGCPQGAIRFTRDHRLATRRREDLLAQGDELRLASALEASALRLFGRSLRLRQVSAGGSGAEEADINVLGTVVYDLARFGVDFVASPRHADGLLVTGPVSRQMRAPLERTYEAVPDPRLVIAVGASAISGGPWRGLPEVVGGVDAVLPVDLYIPGFPPHPLTILDGLLRLLGRLEDGAGKPWQP